MKKFLILPLLSLFLVIGCTKDDDAVNPSPEPPGGENPDGENPDGENPDEGLYTVPDRLADYYAEADLTLEEEDLYDDLAAHTISKHTTFLDYGQRHDYLYDADADVSDPENVVLVYSGESVDWRKYQSPSNPYFNDSEQIFNTEHIYPQSMLPEDHTRADLHVLRVVDRDINGQRSNHPYTDGEGQYKLINGDSFYPGDEWRGDIARIVMYMNLRYNEPFEDVGNLGLFLEWNAEDPVSLFEIQRNDVIERAQGNRNPFIDNPHLATNIWGGEAADNRWDGEDDTEDTEAPSVPEGLTVSGATFESVSLSWEEASDNVAVTKYTVYVDGAYYATSTSTNLEVLELTPGTTYSFSVTASDAYGNESEASEAVEGSTVSDDEAPSVPANLTASNIYATSVSLSWDASTDNAGVKNYDIYVDGEFLKTVYETEYTIGSLTPETTYSFQVLANDIYGNSSELSEALSVTTEKEAEGGTDEGVIVITEYLEGSSYNKALEIGNISDVPVDLSTYSLRAVFNGKTEWANTLQLEGTLEPGEVIVFAHEKADLEGIVDNANYFDTGVINFNGNDAVGLFKNGEVIDLIGVVGDDSEYAKDVTLRRKSTVTTPNTTFTSEEWEELSKDTASGLGEL